MQRKLLIVDDEENIQRSLKRLLRKENYHIHTVSSGKEALEYLKDEEVHVVLSDQRMPQMTGTELLEQIKRLYPDTVRIVLSGYTDLKSITDSINEGAIFKFLTKPWDDEQLKKHIKQAFENYELTHENSRLNVEINGVNTKLEKMVSETKTVQFSYDILDYLSVAVIGIDDTDKIKIANKEAIKLLGIDDIEVGADVDKILKGELLDSYYRCKDTHANQDGSYLSNEYCEFGYKVFPFNDSHDKTCYILVFSHEQQQQRTLATKNISAVSLV